ncbi:siderophore-interacting protein [Methyloversatilis universalis]|uniref:siderophore-interacting protein n=1 Tax=Methyloversatilis universalis TaxID=378211 RepID=UPI000475739F|nr:siderophore-interacting protein [Methyloversatilis universalis]
MTVLHASRAPRRVRHEVALREVEVVGVERTSPNLARITFGGASLAGFVSLSFDDHIKFIFDTPQGERVRRDYTPRRHDAQAGTLALEFALHEDGPASDWARRAQPGQRATIAGPRGSRIVPVDYDWHLLAGDLSALPAIARRLEELPAGTRAVVRLLVPDLADRVAFDSDAALDVRWVASEDALVEALRSLPDYAGEACAWAAGEAALMGRVRDVLAGERALPKEALRVAAYWRRGVADFHDRLTE